MAVAAAAITAITAITTMRWAAVHAQGKGRMEGPIVGGSGKEN
jgi:hypothetical protein